MPLAIPAIKFGGAAVIAGFIWLTAKEGKGIAEASTTAIKWGVVGGGLYLAAKAAKVI